VSLQSKNGVGPGWLEFKGIRYNLFDVSRKVRDATVVCGKQGTWSFDSLLASGQPEVRAIAERLVSIRARSPQEAILQANRILMGDGARTGGTTPVIITDTDVGRLVAKHLCDGGFVAEMILDKMSRARLLKAIDDFQDRLRLVLPFSTDLFWVIHQGRRFSVEIVDEQATVPGADAPLGFPLRKDELVARLNTGEIVPSLFLVFVVLCILPGCVCFGGHRQMAYVEVFIKLLRTALGEPWGDSGLMLEGKEVGRSVWLPDGLGTIANPVTLIARSLDTQFPAIDSDYVLDCFPKHVLSRTRLDHLDPAWYSVISSVDALDFHSLESANLR
jgi:hypothetical protein